MPDSTRYDDCATLRVDTGNTPSSPKRLRLSWTGLAILLFLIAAAVYWIVSDREDNVRAPAPTPIYEDVHEVAP